MQKQILTPENAEKRVSHLLITQESASERLMIMLPGRGYLNEHPVMYYLRMMAVERGFDVLSVTYGFQAHLYSTEGIQGDLLDEIRQAAEPVLAKEAKQAYRQIVIAGKSLGTPLAALYGTELAARFPEAEIAFVLLTPVQKATAAVSERRTLAVIGTADAAYDADLIQSDQDHAWIDWLVLEGLNHGLEYPGDWKRSMAALGQITGACEQFLSGGL